MVVVCEDGKVRESLSVAYSRRSHRVGKRLPSTPPHLNSLNVPRHGILKDTYDAQESRKRGKGAYSLWLARPWAYGVQRDGIKFGAQELPASSCWSSTILSNSTRTLRGACEPRDTIEPEASGSTAIPTGIAGETNEHDTLHWTSLQSLRTLRKRAGRSLSA